MEELKKENLLIIDEALGKLEMKVEVLEWENGTMELEFTRNKFGIEVKRIVTFEYDDFWLDLARMCRSVIDHEEIIDRKYDTLEKYKIYIERS